MNKVKTPKLKWHYINDKDSEKRLEYAYKRILDIAAKNILEKSQKKKT